MSTGKQKKKITLKEFSSSGTGKKKSIKKSKYDMDVEEEEECKTVTIPENVLLDDRLMDIINTRKEKNPIHEYFPKIRCPSCFSPKPAYMYDQFYNMIDPYGEYRLTPKEAFDTLGIDRPCCRTCIISPNIVNKIDKGYNIDVVEGRKSPYEAYIESVTDLTRKEKSRIDRRIKRQKQEELEEYDTGAKLSMGHKLIGYHDIQGGKEMYKVPKTHRIYSLSSQWNYPGYAEYAYTNLGEDRIYTKRAKTEPDYIHQFITAVLDNDLKLVQNLVENTDIDNNLIKIAIQNALNDGNVKMVEYLVLATRVVSDDAVFIAVRSGSYNLVKFFVENGGKYDNKAIELAYRRGYNDIAEFLIEARV